MEVQRTELMSRQRQGVHSQPWAQAYPWAALARLRPLLALTSMVGWTRTKTFASSA